MINPKHELLNTKQFLNVNVSNLKQFVALEFRVSDLFRVYNLEFIICRNGVRI